MEVTDILVEPSRYIGKQVALVGFYGGGNTDYSFIYGKFGGLSVPIHGVGLNPDKKRSLLNSLDGFHRVLVLGTLLQDRKFNSYTHQMVTLPPSVNAKDIEDLGREENPLSFP